MRIPSARWQALFISVYALLRGFVQALVSIVYKKWTLWEANYLLFSSTRYPLKCLTDMNRWEEITLHHSEGLSLSKVEKCHISLHPVFFEVGKGGSNNRFASTTTRFAWLMRKKNNSVMGYEMNNPYYAITNLERNTKTGLGASATSPSSSQRLVFVQNCTAEKPLDKVAKKRAKYAKNHGVISSSVTWEKFQDSWNIFAVLFRVFPRRHFDWREGPRNNIIYIW